MLTPWGIIQFYNKEDRVPLGEYTPTFHGLLPDKWLEGLVAIFGVEYNNLFHPDVDQNPLNLGAEKIGGLICFELIDSGLARRHRERGATLLVNASNLGWFHGHPLLEQQFVAIGQMRAAETGLPLVISANTGVSAVIDGQGQVLGQTPSMSKAVRQFP